MDIGKNIREIREKKNLSQKEVALSIEVAPTQYSRIENNKAVPGLNTLIKVAKALNVTLDAIVFGESSPSEEVKIKDKSLLEKVQMIDALPEDEKSLVIKIIELAVTKKKFKDFFSQQLAS